MRYRAFSHAPQCVIQSPINIELCPMFIPLPVPQRRGLVRRADERGVSKKVSSGTFFVYRGDGIPPIKCFTASLLP